MLASYLFKTSWGLGAELSAQASSTKFNQCDSALKPPKLLLLLVTKVGPRGSAPATNVNIKYYDENFESNIFRAKAPKIKKP